MSDEDVATQTILELEKQVATLRKTNQELHRRLQKVEGPFESYKAQVETAWHEASRGWIGTFERMGVGFRELQCVFRELARAYTYPQDGKSMHSCMDSDASGVTGFGVQKKVFANCFETPRGGIQSFHVVSEVKKAVDELLELRARKET